MALTLTNDVTASVLAVPPQPSLNGSLSSLLYVLALDLWEENGDGADHQLPDAYACVKRQTPPDPPASVCAVCVVPSTSAKEIAIFRSGLMTVGVAAHRCFSFPPTSTVTFPLGGLSFSPALSFPEVVARITT